MYNTHPHISTQEVSICAKMATIVRDRKLPWSLGPASTVGRDSDSNKRMTSDHS